MKTIWRGQIERIGFSALQRAENSSICVVTLLLLMTPGFSALQRAENSSIPDATFRRRSRRTFQCSSASRKFLNRSSAHSRRWTQ